MVKIDYESNFETCQKSQHYFDCPQDKNGVIFVQNDKIYQILAKFVLLWIEIFENVEKNVNFCQVARVKE